MQLDFVYVDPSEVALTNLNRLLQTPSYKSNSSRDMVLKETIDPVLLQPYSFVSTLQQNQFLVFVIVLTMFQ